MPLSLYTEHASSHCRLSPPAFSLSGTLLDPHLSTVLPPEKTATPTAAAPICGSEFEEEEGGGGGGGRGVQGGGWGWKGGGAIRQHYPTNSEGAGKEMGFEGYFRYIT